MINIALDVMGGDHAPENVLEGAFLAVQKLPVKITLVGNEEIITPLLVDRADWPNDRLTICHAPETISMSETPSVAFRKKKKSSIHVGLNLVKESLADGFVSAGNTGAVLTASMIILRNIENIERPAIATVLPGKHGPVVMLDMGSNVDCKPIHLVQFAIMGKYFAELLLGIPNPKIGILNIGEEEDKGDILTQTAHNMLKEMPINFKGNIEGKDILTNKVDVITCDGFVGNSVLKFGESISELFVDFFKSEAKNSFFSKAGLLLLKPALNRFKKSYDYAAYGGAPLLGLNGVSVIAHGKSSPLAIKNAIKSAYDAVESDMVNKIAGAVAEEMLHDR
ncbi:MAG: glycerol-3-phosphate acyltransferase PlsX [Candidatus Marinamargulisbacteria bacterium]|jgi:glycerol-3-phosphate acyltransferase PlsX